MEMRKRKPSRHIRRLKIMGIWMVLMSLFIAELLVYTWVRVQCIRVGYDISAAADKQAELIAEKKKLTIELARLKSPQRIAWIAKTRLNLVTPSPQQIMTIR